MTACLKKPITNIQDITLLTHFSYPRDSLGNAIEEKKI